MRSKFGKSSLLSPPDLKNRRTVLKSSPNRENSVISLKRAQNARSVPCGASVGKISLFRMPDLKFVVLALSYHQIGKTVRFPWKVQEKNPARLEPCEPSFGKISVLSTPDLKIVRLRNLTLLWALHNIVFRAREMEKVKTKFFPFICRNFTIFANECQASFLLFVGQKW